LLLWFTSIELEAANLCIEVRRNEFKKKELEWTKAIEKLKNEQQKKHEYYDQDADEQQHHGNSNQAKPHANFVHSSSATNRNSNQRLRKQMQTLEAHMNTQRAAHGREVSLLRKELKLEQKRVNSLSREINLLRSTDTKHYTVQEISTEDGVDVATKRMVRQTLSSLRDRSV